MGPIKACFTKLYVCGGCQRSTDLEAGRLQHKLAGTKGQWTMPCLLPGHVTVPPLINVVNTARGIVRRSTLPAVMHSSRKNRVIRLSEWI